MERSTNNLIQILGNGGYTSLDWLITIHDRYRIASVSTRKNLDNRDIIIPSVALPRLACAIIKQKSLAW